MKHILLSLTLFALLAPAALTAQQKFGYTNSDALLQQMPETKTAESQLKTLETQLTKQLQQKGQTLEAALKKYEQEVQAGTISPADQKTRETNLQAQVTALQKAEEDAQSRILKKRDELFKPIYTKLQGAISAVAKEKGLNYVFDESVGNFVSGPGSQDITPDIKRKLGIP